MRAGENLVEDDPKRPHVDLGRVRVIAAGTTTHLRGDVRERADLSLEAVVFVGPFGVVEVAEFNPDWEDRGDEDILALLE